MLLVAFAAGVLAQRITVRSDLRQGNLPLVHNGRTASIFYSEADHKVVQLAAADLAADVERVTGKRPNATTTVPAGQTAVIIGTIGKSPLIDGIIKAGKLDVSAVRGKWESFVIRTVDHPMPNVGQALVIVGSDRRGTAFGVYELSCIIGVSPWYWWADATPQLQANLILTRGSITRREPSVKYRGIFINDEDWGLQPWAAKTFEPEAGDIGPKTYAKVFELLLRLKANTLWPAMHEVTQPFNSIAANRQLADDYAIVMGSSHAEPMLRNNVGEWKADKNSFNFVTNPDGVTEYWEQRTRENGKYENIYTIGMRGIHDSPILGTKSQAERIPLLEKIFAVQRGLIAKHVDPKVETVPQIFCPYKEVLADYRAGLKVPDDVTIVFPDDNFGYIRQFPNAEEQKRRGGFGVYYHISYLGRPFSYLWLNTTPPALIWQEMNKAYANGMRNLWIVNVGDIKPGEIGMEFFLQMAYDADRWTIENQHEYLRSFASREFGERNAKEIADILDRYYRLGYQRKPEHLQWYLPNQPQKASSLTNTEKLNRLEDYASLHKRAEAVNATLRDSKKDAFYQLVLYPVRGAALANERFFAAEIAREYGAKWPATGIEWAKRSVAADEAIAAETRYFNETLAGGKWQRMILPEMGAGQWPSMRTTPPEVRPEDFPTPESGAESFRPLAILNTRFGTTGSTDLFSEWEGVVSIEAENYLRSAVTDGFSWQVIKGLGKTGDSVSVLPARAKTFAAGAPSLEYQIEVEKAGDFDLAFFLIPTQPLVPSGGLRLAFSVDGGTPQIVVIDKDNEVSSRTWAQNILDATVRGRTKISLTSGRHMLRIFAVDTGVLLDKIVLSRGELPLSYFGPPETRFIRSKK
ncbi:MAG: glycosyl hydrolase 115 family protein [Pyrinomonadaceae bacterium]